MPPEIWKEKISELSPDDLKEINKYREKFGKNKIEQNLHPLLIFPPTTKANIKPNENQN